MANFWRLLGMSILTWAAEYRRHAALLRRHVSGLSDRLRRDREALTNRFTVSQVPVTIMKICHLHRQRSSRVEMAAPDLIIRGQRVVLPDAIAPRSIHIREERIVFVGDYDDVVENCEVIEAADDSVVMPGLVDTHVHINAPGRTEWEGFRSATLAAAAGGVTTLVDMPLNSIPPTTTLAGFETKLADCAKRLFC